MATVNKNLSDYDVASIPDGASMRIAIVVAEWNEQITQGLLNGAYKTLLKHNVAKENIIIQYVPGSFELPLGAQTLLEKTTLDAVICLGSVIQGETKHFDFVCNATALGIKDVALKYNKPVIFGVLTDNTMQQAIDRSGGKHGNKGDEAAITALKMVAFQKA
ncbi:MAG: 6,7-dimethyl-8-ribityllumazine synthase [Flavobacteriales bacterium BRH_c54]|nr:MAG: 6,7-dimethyl-8-ribityllumazine synthase [Flavobacteriales bacterium BRH_c54]